MGGAVAIEPVAFVPDAPGPGQVRVRHSAAGVNFIDICHRTGLYALPLPTGLGTEAAGIVEAVGPDVDGFTPGERVAYLAQHPGTYATHGIVDADRLLKLPDDDGLDDPGAVIELQNPFVPSEVEGPVRAKPKTSRYA